RDRTVLGVESRIGPNTKTTERYSLEEGAAGTTLRSTAGIETTLPLRERARGIFSRARPATARGGDRSDYASLASGVECRAGASLLSARYELLLGKAETRHTLTASGAFRFREPWTFFVRERVFVTDPKDGRSAARFEGLLGAAYRPLTGPWQFLARLDHSL